MKTSPCEPNSRSNERVGSKVGFYRVVGKPGEREHTRHFPIFHDRVRPGELDVRLIAASLDLRRTARKTETRGRRERSKPSGTGSCRLKDTTTFEKPEASGPLKAST